MAWRAVKGVKVMMWRRTISCASQTPNISMFLFLTHFQKNIKQYIGRGGGGWKRLDYHNNKHGWLPPEQLSSPQMIITLQVHQ